MSADPLPQFLAALARRRWKWAETDCCMPLADWVAIMRGVDPAADLRGGYSDALSCALVMRREGGQRAMLDRRLAAVGIGPVAEPRRGDVGMVKAPAERHGRIVLRQIGAIFAAPDRAAIFTPDAGLMIVSGLARTAAWRV